MRSLRHSLYSAVAYFDVLGLPVTPLQCLPWCTKGAEGPNVTEVLEELRAMVQSSHLDAQDGFFVLQGKRALVRAAQARRPLLHRKWKTALWAAKIFSHIPFVHSVFASGSLTLVNAHEESDVDLFVVARRGALWRARLLTTLIMKLLRRRPGEGSRDPLCLSFYVTRDALDLSPLRTDDNDIHFAFWSASMVPLFDRDGAYTSFRDANAHWWNMFFAVGNFPLSPPPARESGGWVRRALIGGAVRLVSLKLAPAFFERIARAIQIYVLPTALKRRAGEGATAVVMINSVLKFHLNDRRSAYRAAWKERIAHYGEAAVG